MIPSIITNYNSLFTFLEEHSVVVCCIAGGAVRDIILEKPVADIDVFYFASVPSGLDQYKVNHTYENTSFLVTHEFNFPLETGESKKVQLIRLTNPVSSWKILLESFPISISQVGVVQGGLILKTEAFIASVETHIIFWDPDPKHLNYNNKISLKFHNPTHWNWKPVVSFAVPLSGNVTPPQPLSASSFASFFAEVPKKKSPKMYKVLNHPDRIEREFA